MPDPKREEKPVDIEKDLPKYTKPKKKLTLEERVARLERHRFGEEKPYE